VVFRSSGCSKSAMTVLALFTAILLTSGTLGLIDLSWAYASEAPTAQDRLVSKETWFAVYLEEEFTETLTSVDVLLKNQSDKAYEGQIRFLIPPNSRIAQTCEINADGEHLCQPAKTENTADGTIVTWDVGEPVAPGGTYHAYMEWYNPTIAEEEMRQFATQLTNPYDTEKLELTLVLPSRAHSASFTVEAQGLAVAANNGVTKTGQSYRRYVWGAASGGQLIEAHLQYTAAKDYSSLIKTFLLVAGIVGFFGGIIFIALRQSRKNVATHSATRNRPDRGRLGSKGSGDTKGDRDTFAGSNGELDRVRRLLYDGRISEETYKQIVSDIKKSK